MKFSLYDEVVLTSDLPEQRAKAGAIGIVIEVYGPDLFEVDFGDLGRDETLRSHQMRKRFADEPAEPTKP